jgi:methionyl-tRNA formyltransferase
MVNLLNSPKPSIVFVGNERLATGVTTKAPVLQALIDAGYPIEAVIVNNDRATSRKERSLEVAELAAQHNIPVLYEFSTDLTSSIAVLVAYGKIVPRSVINHFAHGIVNVHPSALPKYRGSTPLESVILDGSDATAVSLMQLDVKMDAGAVYAQNDLVLPRTISKQELADAAGELGAQMVIDTLPKILAGTLAPQPQDESQATYTKQISKQDGILDFTKPAAQLEREIRAFAGWPGSSSEINGKPVIITEVKILDESGEPGTFFVHEKQLTVYCGADSLLITKIKPAGKNEMPGSDFLRGNPL